VENLGMMYSGKKVLVTGHTGFKGSWLVEWLHLLGAKVYGMSLDPLTEPNHFSLLGSGVDSKIFDIRNYDLLGKHLKEVKPDLIFHLAAQPLVRESYKDPVGTFETNIMGTANLLNAARFLDDLRGVLVITSDKCYANQEWLWGYRENEPMGGHDPYSASKGAAELVTSCFRNSFYTGETLLASARAGNVIGGGDWSQDRLIPDIIRAVAKNEPMTIRNPAAIRPWQHVLDCLSGYLLLGEKLLQGQKNFAQAWNFGPEYSDCVEVRHIVEKAQKLWPKFRCEMAQNLSAPHEANFLKLDCSKAHSVLEWFPKYNLDKTISATIDWYRTYYEENKIITHQQIKEYMNQDKGSLSFLKILSESPQINDLEVVKT
jgi:CDP-glucose 4,6-dehydratase